MQIGLIILAAGYSKRMGENKALLKYNDEYTFLDQLITQYYKAGIKSIKVISQTQKLPLHKNINTYHGLQIHFVKNNQPELGRSYSIMMGFKEYESFDFVFLQNIDNPFTSKELLKEMISQANENSILVPQVEEKNSHPILLPRKFISQASVHPVKDFDFRDFFSSLPKQFIKWDARNIRANINTPDDYSHWLE